ncbi:MAG: CRISPR-associated protein Cas5 [Lentimicrobium sp.]
MIFLFRIRKESDQYKHGYQYISPSTML